VPADGQHWVSPSRFCHVVSGTQHPRARQLLAIVAIAALAPQFI
jgi:hypothetical protein